MANPVPLQHGKFYHVYNRGINGENIFIETRNYPYFLQLYAQHIHSVMDTYAYCLLRNHFHLLIRVKTRQEHPDLSDLANLTGLDVAKPPSQYFSNFFNAYTKSINKMYGRTGALFERPFRRIEVAGKAYFKRLVTYIHRNPEHHQLVNDFRDWPYSSYEALHTSQPTKVQRERVLDWFDGPEIFIVAQQQAVTLPAPLGLEDE